MATIEQLGIRGIRSFGTDALEVISFTTPLTVIVGQNGAGKTVSQSRLPMCLVSCFLFIGLDGAARVSRFPLFLSTDFG